MARRVRVSALGLRPITFPEGTSYEDMVKGEWDYLYEYIQQVLRTRPDFIVLNEACDRPVGITMEQRKAYYGVRGNRILEKMQETAKENKVNIAYSACLQMEDKTYRNCTVFIGREGEVRGVYNKNYLVIAEYTNGEILYGKEAPVIEMDFGTVGGIICFDLNYMELLSRYEKNRPEPLVFSSMYHGGHVQSHWAYTCRRWFVGACSGLPCNVLNPLGISEASSTNYYPYVTHDINLDYAVVHLDENWQKLEALKEKYGREVTVYDPGQIGAVLITSESDTVSAMDMVKEFDIELLDHYFERSINARYLPGRMEE